MINVRSIPFHLAFFALMVGLVACNGSVPSSPPISPGLVGLKRTSGISKIKHVVILIQENRSFNNLFMGYKGATSQKYGRLHNGKKIKLVPVSLTGHTNGTHFLLQYSLEDFIKQCNGTGSIPGTDCQMNGFDTVPPKCGASGGSTDCGVKYPQYTYVPRSETEPYWDLAEQYVLADQMYASNIDESSFISHQYIIAAQASYTIAWPARRDRKSVV